MVEGPSDSVDRMDDATLLEVLHATATAIAEALGELDDWGLAGTKVDRAWFDLLVGQLGSGDRLGHRPNEMSGGQQQRVACARALIGRPDLVFADEPTGNLDSNSSSEMLGFLRRSVTELGQSIVMVTHDARGAAFADRVVFLADGQVVGELTSPTADRILEQMKQLGN